MNKPDQPVAPDDTPTRLLTMNLDEALAMAETIEELRAEVSRLREDLNTAETLKALDMAETIIELRADVSRLQQENALLRRSLEMLSRDV
jgi:hypothetical protein